MVDSITNEAVSGMVVEIASSSSPDVAILNKTTNTDGYAEFIVNEKDGILSLRQNYVLKVTDPSG